jgi:hypothetical protein
MRERIISEIKRIAHENGKAPGQKTFETQSGIVRREWLGRIWASCGDALSDAGFVPNQLNSKGDTQAILQKIAEACLYFDRFPSAEHLKIHARQNAGFPWPQTIQNHFPKRAVLVEALRLWVKEDKTGKYRRVLDLLPASVPLEIEVPSRQELGHVYLLKAGDYYKIGQSSDLEKRVKSINVALPDKATLEHAISTDDPPGIEAYWHRRFADRRANGEWFKLSKADVLAFKKRKFQ